MKYLLCLIASFSLLSVNVNAQNDLDYLRYSMLTYGSTARSLGMGNSFNALGADFSTLAVNPAGLGLFRRSEMTITPAFTDRNVSNDFEGKVSDDNYFKFALGNFGFVFSNQKKKNKGLKRINFGLGYSRTNNFSSNEYAQYDNRDNTLIDSWVEELNTGAYVPPTDLSTYYPYTKSLAWETYLMDFDTSTGYYSSIIPFAGTRQTKLSEKRGGQGEWSFSMATNFDDRLYVGATIGIPVINYEENAVWSEDDIRDTIPGFTRYKYSTHLRTTGSGFNFKLGAIYRLTDFIRLGAAIHTPTWLYLIDDYRAEMSSDLDNFGQYAWTSPDYIPFEYRIDSPFRVIGSIAIIGGSAAAINFDYEYLDYSMGHIKPRDGQFQVDFSDVNRAIEAKYGAQHNFRAGVELPVNKLRIRLGGEYSTSPFDSNLRPNNQDIDMSRYTLTAGLGYRGEHFYVDGAYAWSKSGSFIYPYTMLFEATPGISTTVTDNRFQFTVGWMFGSSD